MNSKKNLTFIDLFAGCGGLSEGFLQSGNYKGLAHVEWELPMVNTLRNRLENKWGLEKEESLKHVIHFDIQNTNELINGSWSKKSTDQFPNNHKSIINKGLKGLVNNKKVDIIIGGPPCQAYSIAGRAQDKNGMKNDYRNFLFESFSEIVSEFKPNVFVFENVPGILSAKPGGVKVTDRIYQQFKKIGYEIYKSDKLKKAELISSDFGVAQKRKRIIIIGVKKESTLNLDEIYSAINKKKCPTKTVRDVLFGLPKFYPMNNPSKKFSHTGKSNILSHTPRFHNPRDIQIFKDWIKNNMNSKTIRDKINFYNKKFNKKSKHPKYRNLEWDKPSPTIVAHLNKDGLMFIHPDEKQARSITIREAAILQSFPLDYEFIGNQGYCYKMIGNAVPVLMAKAIAKGIYKVIKSKK
jgi:DNA (cytosine-5)-methyltransferase 1